MTHAEAVAALNNPAVAAAWAAPPPTYSLEACQAFAAALAAAQQFVTKCQGLCQMCYMQHQIPQ